VTEGINAYSVTRHRHMPEIEQGLSDACGKDVRVRCGCLWLWLWTATGNTCTWLLLASYMFNYAVTGSPSQVIELWIKRQC